MLHDNALYKFNIDIDIDMFVPASFISWLCYRCLYSTKYLGAIYRRISLKSPALLMLLKAKCELIISCSVINGSELAIVGSIPGRDANKLPSSTQPSIPML